MGGNRPGKPRDRLVAEAARLFAQQGYRATSVADIQLACGLAAGSGALYKHFASKQDLLAAVVRTHVATMREGRQWFVEGLPDDLEQALRLTAQAVWAAMERDRNALRVMLRDLDEFSDLLNEIWTEIRANVYDEFTHWIDRQRDRGSIQVADSGATAAVLLSSLTYYPILDTLLSHTPGDIESDRYLETWITHAMTVLSPCQAEAPPDGTT